MKKIYLLATTIIIAASSCEVFAMESYKADDHYIKPSSLVCKKNPINYYPFIESINKRTHLGDDQYLLQHQGQWFQISQGSLAVLGNMHYNVPNAQKFQIIDQGVIPTGVRKGKNEYTFSMDGVTHLHQGGQATFFCMKSMDFGLAPSVYNDANQFDQSGVNIIAPNWAESTEPKISASLSRKPSSNINMFAQEMRFNPFINSLNQRVVLGEDLSGIKQYLFKTQEQWFQISQTSLSVILDIYNNTFEPAYIGIQHDGMISGGDNDGKSIYIFSKSGQTLKNNENKDYFFRMKPINFGTKPPADEHAKSWQDPVVPNWSTGTDLSSTSLSKSYKNNY